MLRTTLAVGTGLALTLGFAGGPRAQVAGGVDQAVGGFSFEEAAQPRDDIADFRSGDGKLTFAIVTHTAGNGFFDPTYVGAQVAANAFGVNLLRLGSEAPVDDIPRELEILNQIIQDPTLDGLAMTTPQAGAYDDIVAKAFELGIPVATFNSYDPTILNRSRISHTGQSAAAAAIGGLALAECVLASGTEGGTILFPSTTTLGNVEVNERVTAAFNATVLGLNAAGRLGGFRVDAGPTNIGVDVDPNNIVSSIVSLIESRGDVVGVMGANGFVTPAIGDAVAQLGIGDDVCSFGYDLGPKQLDQIRNGHLDGSLGQQPFLQGFYPIAQLYLEIDRGVSAANLDTSAQLITRENVDTVGKRFEN
ncbi:MAG TPA: substrate-binding domain-containing protein [Geminicoccaceae bacterium]|nr:substrate-binding domain-containing protein [Geminicoccaceae bacterium]